MRTKTVTVREGEKLGPIDWTYNFRQHFGNYCMSEERKDQLCERITGVVREIETEFNAGKKVGVWTDGDFYHEVLDIGMYDGWPFWKPVPHLYLSGPLGGEWTPFYSVRRHEVKAPSVSQLPDHALDHQAGAVAEPSRAQRQAHQTAASAGADRYDYLTNQLVSHE